MERLIDKIFNKVDQINEKVDGKVDGEINGEINEVDGEINRINEIINIKKLKNVEINDENDKKLFIYKGYGIQIKKGIKFKIIFFKMNNESDLEKLFELVNVKIKVSNQLVIMYKYNEIWNYELYDIKYQDLLNYFCVKFNIKAITIEQ